MSKPGSPQQGDPFQNLLWDNCSKLFQHARATTTGRPLLELAPGLIATSAYIIGVGGNHTGWKLHLLRATALPQFIGIILVPVKTLSPPLQLNSSQQSRRPALWQIHEPSPWRIIIWPAASSIEVRRNSRLPGDHGSILVGELNHPDLRIASRIIRRPQKLIQPSLSNAARHHRSNPAVRSPRPVSACAVNKGLAHITPQHPVQMDVP